MANPFRPITAPDLFLPSTTSSNLPAVSTTPTSTHPSSTTANPPASESPLNPRSCITCRRRKVRCDKRHPCSNCARARVACVFPGPGRAPRRKLGAGSRTGTSGGDGELVERLRRLEEMVRTLGTQVQEETGVRVEFVEEEVGAGVETGKGKGVEKTGEEKGDERNLKEQCEKMERLRKECVDVDHDGSKEDTLEERFGRLVVEEGRSRYVTSNFWANLGKEVEDIRAILNEEEEEEEGDSPESNQSSHQDYIFGYSSKMADLYSLHPPADAIPTYWEVYKDNVDPMLKILHVPSMEAVILDAKDHLDTIRPGLEALLFAIYYNCATSLSGEECLTRLRGEKGDLISRYRFGVEQALARANFLQTDEMVVLQAFVMFLIALRHNDDARVIWTLVGLVVRMAQTIGIHRDGTHFDLKPFDIEMRRRLWWQTCILDVRAAEDHGCDPTTTEHMYDTRCPLNINDSDLRPDMAALPDERVGCTDMTFSIIRVRVADLFRRLYFGTPPLQRCPRISRATLEMRERWITDLHQQLEEQFLRHCDMSVPLHWVIATVSRLTLAKMWLIAYHPFQRLDGGRSLPQTVRDKLFITSLENVEYALLLEKEERTRKWGWLFKTYMQWHAVVYLLTELCVRTEGPTVERAWRAVDEVTQRRWGEDVYVERGTSSLWKPLRKLIAKARAARARAMRPVPGRDAPGAMDLWDLEFDGGRGLNFSSAGEAVADVGGTFAPQTAPQAGASVSAVSRSSFGTPSLSGEGLSSSDGSVRPGGSLGAAVMSDSPLFGAPLPQTGPQQTNVISFDEPQTMLGGSAGPDWPWWDEVMKDFSMDGDGLTAFRTGGVGSGLGPWV